MNTRKDLSIIIPVYNEPLNIKKTLLNIKKNIKTKNQIIVVYDSEKDRTLPVLKRLKSEYRNLTFIKNDVCPGPSGAIRTGIKESNSKRVLVMMADLCDDINQVDQMVKLVPDKFDIICPSRYTKGGRQELNDTFKVGIPRLSGMLLKGFTGITTSDPTNSYKLYSKRLLNKIHLKSTISFSVTLEIVAKAHVLHSKIYEIPTVWKDRQHGKTNFKLGRSIVAYFPWFLFAIMRNRLFDIGFLLKPFL